MGARTHRARPTGEYHLACLRTGGARAGQAPAVGRSADSGGRAVRVVSLRGRLRCADAGQPARRRRVRPRGQPGGHLAVQPLHSDPVRPRLPGWPVRPDHDGRDLRNRDRAPGGRDLLPDVRIPRRQRLHPAPGDLLRSHLPRDGSQRQSRPADGARPRLRHDGDDDDEDSGDAEGAADRDPAAGAGNPVLGATGHDSGHSRRDLVRGARDAGWPGARADVPGGVLAARRLKGERSEFIMELPPIRWPKIGNLLTKTRLRIWWYLGEAVPLFLVGTVLLFGLDRVGALIWISRAGRPVVTGLLGLPPATAQILVMGFLRRDYRDAGLSEL